MAGKGDALVDGKEDDGRERHEYLIFCDDIINVCPSALAEHVLL